jgi:mono/diheme cytochrome c family protein
MLASQRTPRGANMKHLIILLPVVLSAGVCSTWSQTSMRSQAAPGTPGQPLPEIKLRLTTIKQHPPTAGKEMYVSYCAACHGKDGKGTGPAAPALKRRVPDLSSLSAQNQGRYPKYLVLTTLSKHGESHWPGTASEMPDWYREFVSLNRTCPLLADVRAHSISEYVETLQVAQR